MHFKCFESGKICANNRINWMTDWKKRKSRGSSGSQFKQKAKVTKLEVRKGILKIFQ